jgi:7-cyano-7-deazaguanine synthase
LARYARVETVGYFYGQRHAVELECRTGIRETLGQLWPGLGADHVLDISTGMAALGATAMTSDVEIGFGREGLPNTFVPGRNLLFLTYAASLAYRRGLRRIVGGMCETDFSGYPDCRDDTVKAMQVADVIIDQTHTCYRGERGQKHAWGYGCGTCPACRLRADGYDIWRKGEPINP